MAWWHRYQVEVPAGECGLWKVVKFDTSGLTPEEARAAQRQAGGREAEVWGRYIPPGRYTALRVLTDAKQDRRDPFAGEAACCTWQTMMCDSPPEIRDALPFMRAARGHVLILGLGLGIVPRALLRFYPRVKRVTVVEKSDDVLALVGPTYTATPRLEIVHADAFAWRPPAGVRFDCAWSDIWLHFAAPENLPELQRLRDHYRDVVDGPHFGWAEFESELTDAVVSKRHRGRRREHVIREARALVTARTWGRASTGESRCLTTTRTARRAAPSTTTCRAGAT